MLAIKLSRIGKKKEPHYRLVVVPKTKDPWGDVLEIVGFYNPRQQPKVFKFDEGRLKYWLSKGAQPTTTVHNLLVNAKIISGAKKKAHAVGQKQAEAAKEKSAVPSAAAQTAAA